MIANGLEAQVFRCLEIETVSECRLQVLSQERTAT